MSDGLFFFYFMKVGAGNAFMDFPGPLGELEEREGLFVGYHDRDIPEITDDGEFLGTLTDPELQTIARASRKALRAHSIACVFTDSHLTFWQITGYLGAMPEEEVRRFASIPYKDLNQALSYDKQWQKARKEVAGGKVDVAAFFSGYHWLPAKLLIPPVPRYELLAPVDSLRVHRWLNSGTFRSLHSIKGNGLMGDVEWLPDPLDPKAIRSGKEETPYARLVRQYLTGLLHPSTRIDLDDRQVTDLASLWINPAQLETVGALLALDLGFTLEVGLGKGQDVVDIKASLGHLEGRVKKAAVQSVLECLEGVLQVSMTRTFRDRITEQGIFWLQCKAQDLDDKPKKKGIEQAGEDRALRGKGPDPNLVLTLMPGASRSGASSVGRLYLSRLMECVREHQGRFPHLFNWRRVYTDQIRQGMCRDRGPR
jgi:hypothetical protein